VQVSHVCITYCVFLLQLKNSDLFFDRNFGACGRRKIRKMPVFTSRSILKYVSYIQLYCFDVAHISHVINGHAKLRYMTQPRTEVGFDFEIKLFTKHMKNKNILSPSQNLNFFKLFNLTR